jgi:hypothetical protein
MASTKPATNVMLGCENRPLEKEIPQKNENGKYVNPESGREWDSPPDTKERLLELAKRDGLIQIPEQHGMTEEEFSKYKPIPEGPRFECKLPKDHFLMRFMAYGQDISDAYPEYWFAGGLHALYFMNDKKTFVKLRQMIVYCNMWLTILGKSTISRKTTAAAKTESLEEEVWPILLDAKVPTEFSAEAFIEHMDKFNHAPWIRDEAAGVLGIMKKDYMRGFKDCLMQLFDCHPVHRLLRTSQRKNSKTDFRVDDPYLNIFYATTGASFGANTEQNDTLSGFLARFMYFSPQRPKDKWLPLEEGSALNSDLEDVVRSQLVNIANVFTDLPRTALHFSPETAKYVLQGAQLLGETKLNIGGPTTPEGVILVELQREARKELTAKADPRDRMLDIFRIEEEAKALAQSRLKGKLAEAGLS